MLRTITLLLFIVLYISGQAQTPSFKPEDGALIAEAKKLLDNKEYDEALKLIDTFINRYPNVAIGYVLKGDIITKSTPNKTVDKERYQQAKKALDKAIEIDPSLLDAYMERGELNATHQKYKLAVKDFTRVIHLSPKDSKLKRFGLNGRGLAKIYLKDYKNAILDFENALSFTPNNVDLISNIALTYDHWGKFNKAIKYYKKGLDIDPKNAIILNNIAFIYLKQGKIDKSIQVFNQTLALNPNSPLALNNLGFAYFKKGDTDKALSLINQSISIYPTNSYAYRNKALIYIELKQMKKACIALQKAHQLGFHLSYGEEVNDLLKKHCSVK